MKYAIIRILKLKHWSDKEATKRCWKMVDNGYNNPEIAISQKNKMDNPDHYIIIQYWP